MSFFKNKTTSLVTEESSDQDPVKTKPLAMAEMIRPNFGLQATRGLSHTRLQRNLWCSKIKGTCICSNMDKTVDLLKFHHGMSSVVNLVRPSPV